MDAPSLGPELQLPLRLPTSESLTKQKNDNYFWPHGYQVVLSHISANCKKDPGHKDASTKENIIGGDTWGSEFL
jgi:hypothetical protein